MRIDKKSQFSINKLRELIEDITTVNNNINTDVNNLDKLHILLIEARSLLTSWQNVLLEVTKGVIDKDQRITAISEVNNWATIRNSYWILKDEFDEVVRLIED